MKILLIKHEAVGHTPECYEVIGPFFGDSGVDSFIRNESIGERGWVRLDLQDPVDVIRYFEGRK